ELDIAHEQAQAVMEEASQAVNTLAAAEREAEKECTQWQAREEALSLGLRRRDGAGALLAAGDRVPGLIGSVAALLGVEPGCEAALAAALGGLADAVAVSGVGDATEALRLLKIEDAGRASVLIAGGDQVAAEPVPATPPVTLPEGARWAVDVVRCPVELRRAVAHALHGVVLVPDLAAAGRLV